MQPTNLTLFRFPVREIWQDHCGEDLEALLAEHRLKPVGALELSSVGFVPPLGQDSETLTHRVGNAIWITLGIEAKILPSAAVNDLLWKKLAAIEEREGRRLGGRARKRVKEDLVHELLPRAFVRPARCNIMVDVDNGVVAIDTASRKMAETAVSMIRTALGSFPALPLNAEVAPRSVLTGWVADDPLPENWGLGEHAEMREPDSRGAVVKVHRHELKGEEVRKHLDAGMQVVRLGVEVADHVSMTVCEDLVIRRFRLLDGALDQLDGTEREDLRAELDARFALFIGEFRRVFGAMERAMRLSKVEG